MVNLLRSGSGMGGESQRKSARAVMISAQMMRVIFCFLVSGFLMLVFLGLDLGGFGVFISNSRSAGLSPFVVVDPLLSICPVNSPHFQPLLANSSMTVPHLHYNYNCPEHCNEA